MTGVGCFTYLLVWLVYLRDISLLVFLLCIASSSLASAFGVFV